MKNRLGQELVAGDVIVRAYKTSCGVLMRACVVEEVCSSDRYGGKYEWARVRCVADPDADRDGDWDRENDGPYLHGAMKMVGKVTPLHGSDWIKLGSVDGTGAAVVAYLEAANAKSDAENARRNQKALANHADETG